MAAAGASPIPVEGGVEFAARTDEDAAACLRAVVQAGVAVVDFRRLDTGLADVVLRVLEGGQP